MLRALALLVLTFLVELPSTLIRLFVFGFIGTAVLSFTTSSAAYVLVPFLVWVVVLLPLLAAIAAMLWPVDFLTSFTFGARRPSEREQAMINDAVGQFVGPHVMPRRWHVVDSPVINAFVVANDIYLDRELIHTPYLAPLIAHELGHIHNRDGNVMLALRRITMPPQLAILAARLVHIKANGQERTGCVGCVTFLPVLFFALFGGGWGMRFTVPLWLWWMRDGEFAADAYAASLGQDRALAQVLDDVALHVDMAVPYMQGRTHPYTELRIEKLLQYEAGATPVVANVQARVWVWRATAGAVIAVLLLPLLFATALGFIGRSMPADAASLRSTARPTSARFPTMEAVSYLATTAPATPESTATPDVQATVAAVVAATRQAQSATNAPTDVPTATVAGTPDVQATVAAAVQATMQAGATATPDAPSAADRKPDNVTASDKAPSAQDAAGNTISYDAANVIDGNPDTAWRVPGPGRYQSVELGYTTPVLVREVDIIPGYAKIDPASGVNRFAENRRVRSVQIAFSDGSHIDTSFTDDPTSQPVTLPKPVTTTFVRVIITDVTEDGGRDFAAISEIAVK